MSRSDSAGLVTWLGLLVVAGAAAVLSFEALRSLAMLCGTPDRLAWLLPVSIDAAAVVATRVWLAGSTPTEARSHARRIALGALGLSVAGNASGHILEAYAVAPPWWAVVVVAAVPPAVLGAVAHLAAMVVSKGREQARPGDDQVPPGVDQPEPADLLDRAREVVAKGEESGDPIGRIRLATILDIPESQARRLLDQIRQEAAQDTPAKLRAVGGEST